MRLRGVSWLVSRMDSIDRASALRTSTFGSRAHVHFVASPAFRFADAPCTGAMVEYLRRFAKNQSLSFLIGPPPEPLMSQELVMPAGCSRPYPISVSFRLLPVDHLPAPL